MRKHWLMLAAALFLFAGANVPAAKAAFVMVVQETGSNVVGVGVGNINTAGLSVNLNAASDSAQIFPGFEFGSLLILGQSFDGPVELDTGITGPTSFGNGPSADTLLGTGDLVGVIAGDGLYLPNNYVSGTPLSDTSTWSNTTLAGLGITPGTYTWTWGSGATADSLTLIAGVPEPASFGAVSLAGLALLLRRRRTR